jgi:hypothetical protein
MRRKWRLPEGSRTLVIVPRSELFPPEAPTLDPAQLLKGIDAWLANPVTRQTVLEIYGALCGAPATRQADDDSHLQNEVKPRLAQAFKRRDLVGLLIPPTYLTQAPIVAAVSAEPRPVPVAPPAAPSPVRERPQPPPLARPSPIAIAQAAALAAAARSGRPFCEACEKPLIEPPARAIQQSLAVAQVAALTSAARSGLPLCEKCEEKQASMPAPSAASLAQAATLVAAAESGHAFCEKCEEATGKTAA